MSRNNIETEYPRSRGATNIVCFYSRDSASDDEDALGALFDTIKEILEEEGFVRICRLDSPLQISVNNPDMMTRQRHRL